MSRIILSTSTLCGICSPCSRGSSPGFLLSGAGRSTRAPVARGMLVCETLEGRQPGDQLVGDD